jgi:heat shock protein HslJ
MGPVPRSTASRRAVLIAMVLLVATAAASCGSSDDAGDREPTPSATTTFTTARLEGSTFVAEDVQGRDLVAGTQVRVSFEDGTMAVVAGCNTLFGAYELVDGTLRWAREAASTRKACPEELSAQDDWLAAVLADGVAASVDGDRLTLRGGPGTLSLRRVAG